MEDKETNRETPFEVIDGPDNNYETDRNTDEAANCDVKVWEEGRWVVQIQI